jgi:hypothetical protein
LPGLNGASLAQRLQKGRSDIRPTPRLHPVQASVVASPVGPATPAPPESQPGCLDGVAQVTSAARTAHVLSTP